MIHRCKRPIKYTLMLEKTGWRTSNIANNLLWERGDNRWSWDLGTPCLSNAYDKLYVTLLKRHTKGTAVLAADMKTKVSADSSRACSNGVCLIHSTLQTCLKTIFVYQCHRVMEEINTPQTESAHCLLYDVLAAWPQLYVSRWRTSGISISKQIYRTELMMIERARKLESYWNPTFHWDIYLPYSWLRYFFFFFSVTSDYTSRFPYNYFFL